MNTLDSIEQDELQNIHFELLEEYLFFEINQK